MADKTKFVGDFRSAATTILDAGAQLGKLTTFATNMGWVQADFDTVCAGTDITSADLFTAITSVASVMGTMTAQAAALAKMRA
jgi:hypothetical protein